MYILIKNKPSGGNSIVSISDICGDWWGLREDWGEDWKVKPYLTWLSYKSVLVPVVAVGGEKLAISLSHFPLSQLDLYIWCNN